MAYQLTKLRKDAGYKSRKEFAERADISEYTYKNWETKPGTIPLEKACDICDILGCTLDELAGREVPDTSCSRDEQRVINDYRACDAEHKRMLETNARLYAGDSKKREDHTVRGYSEGIA